MMLPDWPDLKELLAQAASEVMFQSIYARHPYLALIRQEVYREGDKSSYTDVNGTLRNVAFQRFTGSSPLADGDIPNSDFATHTARLCSIGAQMSDQIASHLFKTVKATTEEVGNVVTTSGGLRVEHLYEMFEKAQMDFDDTGKPAGRAFVAGREMCEQLPRLLEQVESDREWKRRFDELTERKREEWRARESNRRLVD